VNPQHYILQGICTSKLPPQGNEEKYFAQKMKITCNCECMLYKCFKSKWKKCYCIDKNIDISNINILGILQGHKKYALKQKNIKVNHTHLKKCTNNLSLFTYLPTLNYLIHKIFIIVPHGNT